MKKILLATVILPHNLTPPHLPYQHYIFQRLYYLPLIPAALWFGFRGGLLARYVLAPRMPSVFFSGGTGR